MSEPEAWPRILCNTRELTAEPPTAPGAQWKLAESGRQLDANLVRVAPGEHIPAHAEPDLDVLVLVVSGTGLLGVGVGVGAASEAEALAEGALVWLPHGSTRSITAGEGGLAYLTVHRRRPGMQIRRDARP